MNVFDVFNSTTTTNGDDAFLSSKNSYIDIVFRLIEGRQNPSIFGHLLKDTEYDKWFSMLIRDPRLGFGEREIGRQLMWQTNIEPETILNCGRADDIFWIGFNHYKQQHQQKNPYWLYLFKVLTKQITVDKMSLFNITKWMPRERGQNREAVYAFRESFDLSSKAYRKLVVNHETVEAILSRQEKIQDYSTVPSLAMLKHFNTFLSKDSERFNTYLENVKKGEAKLNVGTSSFVNIWTAHKNGRIDFDNADLMCKLFPKLNLGKMLCIVDQSGSMHNINQSYLQARAIGHYVTINNSYDNNNIVVFSSEPRLVNLGDTFKSAYHAFGSFNDVSNTNFGKVMSLLSKATIDIPDWLLVLSDMQFDQGSSQSKDSAMSTLRHYNPNIKIIWWNLNHNRSTFPETDEYGNIFMSGYSAQLLQFLESGFNSQEFINRLIENYKKTYNRKFILIK